MGSPRRYGLYGANNPITTNSDTSAQKSSIDDVGDADSATLGNEAPNTSTNTSWRRSMLSKATGKRVSKSTLRSPGQFTFFREDTPPNTAPGDIVPSNHHQQDVPYDYSYDRIAPPAPIPEPTMYGLRRRTFWMVVSAIAFVIVLAVGLGVGLGVGLKNRSSDSSTSPVTTDPTAKPTTSSLPVSPTSTSEPSTDAVSCPSANSTIYKVPSTNTTFLRVCGVDYSGVNQAKDLASIWTMSMADCMFQCADYPGCTACGWGVIPGDPGSEHRCWLKSDIKTAHQSRAGWEFAIKQQ